MYGCEIVWPSPIGSAASSYARSRSSSGTNCSRATRVIAASTRSSETSRTRSCRSTIRCRSGSTRERSRVRRRLDAEVAQDRRRDVAERLGDRVEADGEHRPLGVAGAEGAVAAAAGVMPPCEVCELHAGSRRDDDVAGVRVLQRGPGARAAVGIVEQRRARTHGDLLAVAPGKDLVAFAEEDGLRSGLVVEQLRERAGVELAPG